MSEMECCTDPTLGDQVASYAFGVLAGPGQELIEDHLMVCAHCRAELQRLEPAIRALQAEGGRLVDELMLQHAPTQPEPRLRRLLATIRHTFEAFAPIATEPAPLPLRRSGEGGQEFAPGVADQLRRLQEEGNPARIAAFLRRQHAQETEPFTPAVYWRVGVQLLRAGQVIEAGQMLRIALEGSPDHPHYRWSAALAAMELGDLPQALAHLSHVAESYTPLAAEAAALKADLLRQMLGASGQSGGAGGADA